MRAYTEAERINHYTTQPQHRNKTSIAERCIRTIRIQLGRRLTNKAVSNFPNTIRAIEHSLNNTVNTVTGLKPNETTNNDAAAILSKERLKRLKIKPEEVRFAEGQLVRLRVVGGSAFRKSNEPGFSKEVFKILSVKKTEPIASYKVANLETGIAVTGTISERDLVAA